MAWHSSILPWKFHGQRSLVGSSPWGCKELDTTEWLSTHPGSAEDWQSIHLLMLSSQQYQNLQGLTSILFPPKCNGTPLQYSCLENPMDGGAWWAAVHGVATSRTRLSDLTFTFHFHALEKEMATHSSVLAWRIPGTGEPGGLPSMGSNRVGHDWSDLAAAAAASGLLLSMQGFSRPYYIQVWFKRILTREPEINPYTYSQLIFDKEGKNIKWGKKSLFSLVVLEKLNRRI